ncbi:hypothetical protein J7L02_01755 [Candidatus Woesearchaeota archaeon]|nr:hypothetical protein [Candidatus Woesearchaeota archaeon]
MRFKRSQAALEFLTTYGWAILVVLVMIGALAYFGVLNPSKFAQERCAGGSIFSCSGNIPDNDTINLELTNQLPQKITVDTDKNKWSVKLADGSSIKIESDITPSDDGILNSGEHETFKIDLSDEVGDSGDKVKLEIQVPYTREGSSLTQKATIELIATVNG